MAKTIKKTTKVDKDGVIKQYQLHEGDTGSPYVQVGLLTAKINNLVEHLNDGHKKDASGRRGLIKLVGQRRRHLKYIERTDGAEAVVELKKKVGMTD